MVRTLCAVILLSIALAGCAMSSCPAGLRAFTQADLYFGRNIPSGGEIGEADWQRFVDEEVAPRFPGGLSVTDAAGQWKGQAEIVRELSKHVMVVLPGTPDDRPKLEAIRAAYKARFRQDSVLLLEAPVCGSF